MHDEWRSHSRWPDAPPSWPGWAGHTAPPAEAIGKGRRRWPVAAAAFGALLLIGAVWPDTAQRTEDAAATSEFQRAPVDLSALDAPAVPPTASTPSPRAVEGSTPTRSDLSTEAALATLTGLPESGATSKSAYSRARFGEPWADVDGNGCDTRNDVLRRDLTAVVVEPGDPGCVVRAGVLHDPYGGTTVEFALGTTSRAIEIDHLVSLADAWRSGAADWTDAERRAFANDPAELLATTAEQNHAKGDGNAAAWLPPVVGYRCAYVSKQVAVKQRYGLSVTPQERDVLTVTLGLCGGRGATVPVPTRTAAPSTGTPVASTPPASVPRISESPPSVCEPSYPTICLPPAADHADLDCGEITQRRFTVREPDPYRLDSDNDGVGCES